MADEAKHHSPIRSTFEALVVKKNSIERNVYITVLIKKKTFEDKY